MFRLPVETQIGHAHLQVSGLTKALTFYADLLGFKEVRREGAVVMLSATGRAPYHLLLTERPGAGPKPPGTTGLFHVAIRLPNRHELGRMLFRLLMQGWPYEGLADHGVSESLYLSDPDGNGIEFYADRPREQWPRCNDQIHMITDPLDIKTLLREVELKTDTWTGIHPESGIGHIHLRVSDLLRAKTFYHNLLGLDVTQQDYPGALFLSAGGYHHHIGLNVWEGVGAPPPPPDAVGLLSFVLFIPDKESWHTLKARVQTAGVRIVNHIHHNKYATGILIYDPDGNGVELLVPLLPSSPAYGHP